MLACMHYVSCTRAQVSSECLAAHAHMRHYYAYTLHQRVPACVQRHAARPWRQLTASEVGAAPGVAQLRAILLARVRTSG